MTTKTKVPAGSTHYDSLCHHWKLQQGVWRVYKHGKGWVPSTPVNLQPIWPKSDERIDIIGTNGNDGLHYEA